MKVARRKSDSKIVTPTESPWTSLSLRNIAQMNKVDKNTLEVYEATLEEWAQANIRPWEERMRDSDRELMPRALEEHITADHGGVTADPILQQKYNDKIIIRASKE